MKTRSTSDSMSDALSGSASAAQTMVWSGCAAIPSAVGRTRFCGGCQGLGGPTSRDWQRSLASVSASGHAGERSRPRT
jgi:hypothetical protein